MEIICYHNSMTLTELRESKNLSVREVARRMGQTHPNVLRIEREGSAPGKTMDAYAAALGVEYEEVAVASRETRHPPVCK